MWRAAGYRTKPRRAPIADFQLARRSREGFKARKWEISWYQRAGEVVVGGCSSPLKRFFLRFARRKVGRRKFWLVGRRYIDIDSYSYIYARRGGFTKEHARDGKYVTSLMGISSLHGHFSSIRLYEGSFKFSVAIVSRQPCDYQAKGPRQTFKMKEDVRLVILEHLRDQLDVHVLYVDLLLCRQPSAPYNAGS